MNIKNFIGFLSLIISLTSGFQAFGMETSPKKPSPEDADRLFSLYVKYFQKATTLRSCIQLDLTVLLGKYETLQNLDTDYSIDEIEQNYAKYGIIILRDPTKSKNLLIGAGNSPIVNNCPFGDFEHKDYITINPDLSMNPTIVGGFGVDAGIPAFIKDRNHTFKVLASECVTIGNSLEHSLRNPVFAQSLEIFDENFENKEINGRTHVTEDFGTGLNGLRRSAMFWIG